MGAVIAVGAGPAGLIAAIIAARSGRRVLLLEKNSQPGRKLLLTGGGRCNLTNSFAGETEGYYPGGGLFLHSAISQFPPDAVCAFFRELGVEVAQEEEGKIFPAVGKAPAVLTALTDELARLGVEVYYQRQVAELLQEKGRLRGVRTIGGEEFCGSKVILATGGASYPTTGSTGDGYAIASSVGHKILEPRAALTPWLVEQKWPRSLAGLSFAAEAELRAGKRTIRERGQLLCTHFGLSGPLALNLSRHLAPPQTVKLNLLPQLEDQVAATGEDAQSWARLLPRRLVAKILELALIEPGAKNISSRQREALRSLLFQLPVTVTGIGELARATVTRGGVKLGEVNPKTMASKLIPGLYFAGELLDIDGKSGGYNLTAAFATGFAAGGE